MRSPCSNVTQRLDSEEKGTGEKVHDLWSYESVENGLLYSCFFIFFALHNKNIDTWQASRNSNHVETFRIELN